MACYTPRQGFRAKGGGFTSDRRKAALEVPMTVPCGQCIGCRLERSRQWAIRCTHEASQYENNCFITLTYSNENLPHSMSIGVRPFQLFIKRLRKKYGSGIRFYGCGEYGGRFGRPHYHACLFNHDFKDKKLWKESKTGDHLYRSKQLEAIWPYGYCSIGTMTFQSAAYVARYLMKKINGNSAEKHYEYIDEFGEVHARKPEFTIMSRKPGIGANWLEKYASDIYPGDFVILKGKRMRPPKYYDTLYEKENPEDMKRIKRNRQDSLNQHADNNTEERLKVRETIQTRKMQLLHRDLEKENDK